MDAPCNGSRPPQQSLVELTHETTFMHVRNIVIHPDSMFACAAVAYGKHNLSGFNIRFNVQTDYSE